MGRGSKIENCYSLCEINSTSTTAGGIAGFCSLKIAKTEIKNCIVLSEKINGYMNRYRIAVEDAMKDFIKSYMSVIGSSGRYSFEKHNGPELD